MRFQLQFDMDNAAFEEVPTAEAARILRKVADHVEIAGMALESHPAGVILDVNGNRVGSWSIEVDS